MFFELRPGGTRNAFTVPPLTRCVVEKGRPQFLKRGSDEWGESPQIDRCDRLRHQFENIEGNDVSEQPKQVVVAVLITDPTEDPGGVLYLRLKLFVPNCENVRKRVFRTGPCRNRDVHAFAN